MERSQICLGLVRHSTGAEHAVVTGFLRPTRGTIGVRRNHAPVDDGRRHSSLLPSAVPAGRVAALAIPALGWVRVLSQFPHLANQLALVTRFHECAFFDNGKGREEFLPGRMRASTSGNKSTNRPR